MRTHSKGSAPSIPAVVASIAGSTAAVDFPWLAQRVRALLELEERRMAHLQGANTERAEQTRLVHQDIRRAADEALTPRTRAFEHPCHYPALLATWLALGNRWERFDDLNSPPSIRVVRAALREWTPPTASPEMGSSLSTSKST